MEMICVNIQVGERCRHQVDELTFRARIAWGDQREWDLTVCNLSRGIFDRG